MAKTLSLWVLHLCRSSGEGHFGKLVRKDQLLAEIDTPEIDQQLQQARADLDTAQADLNLAQITAVRWQGLVKDGSVSQQETDQAVSNLKACKRRSNPTPPTCDALNSCSPSKKSTPLLTESSQPIAQTLGR